MRLAGVYRRPCGDSWPVKEAVRSQRWAIDEAGDHCVTFVARQSSSTSLRASHGTCPAEAVAFWRASKRLARRKYGIICRGKQLKGVLRVVTAQWPTGRLLGEGGWWHRSESGGIKVARARRRRPARPDVLRTPRRRQSSGVSR